MTLPRGAVWLDAQGAQNFRHLDRGIPRYVNEHVRALLELAPDAVGHVMVDRRTGVPGTLQGLPRLAFTDAPPGPPPPLYHVMSPFELERPIDVVWPPFSRTTRLVLTVYDLIPAVFEDVYLRDPVTRARYFARAELVRRADHVLAISQATADDVERLAGVPAGRITVVDAGVTTTLVPPATAQEALAALQGNRFAHLRPGFAFYVGGIDPRKNMDRIIRVWARLAPEVRRAHQLVLTCKTQPHEAEHLNWVTRDAGMRPDRDVVVTGFVDDAELAALYRASRLFVFPSLYEGSGLPILEAMSMGLPVVASRASTTPEILGDLDGTFDPQDEAEMAAVIGAALTDDARLARLAERSARLAGRFTWRRVAERSVAGYEAALARSPRAPSRGRGRPRLAITTPWPPEPSGVATYSHRLVAALRHRVDVDVVTAGGRSAGEAMDGVRLVKADALGVSLRLRRHDRLLHCMGNSGFHGHVREALVAHGGAVLLHDVRLVGFYGWYAGVENPYDPYGQLSARLDAAYGHRIGHGAFAHLPPGAEDQYRLGLLLTDEMRRHADTIVVHSGHARELLEADAGGPIGRPVHVVPHAFGDPPDGDPLDGRDEAHVVHFGIVAAVKGIGTLLDAFAEVLGTVPHARLTLAGGGEADELERFRRQARELGLQDAVTFLGHTGDADWDRLLATATVAVQLRTTTNGETSGTIVECLTAGLPAIVSDLGWPAELPPDTTLALPFGAGAPALAGALRRLLGDPDERRRRGLAGRELARRWSYEAVADRLLEVLL